MKAHLLYLIVIFALILSGCRNNKTPLEQELSVLNKAIDKQEDYDAEKEAKIINFKEEFSQAANSQDSLHIANHLLREYESFRSDSSLFYANMCLRLTSYEVDSLHRIEALLNKANLLAKTGLYGNAMEIQKCIDKKSLSPQLLTEYYHNFYEIYRYLSEYSNGSGYEDCYQRLSNEYLDSVLSVSKKSSFLHTSFEITKLINQGHLAEARKNIESDIHKYPSGTRSYSILASLMADTYALENDSVNESIWLARSAESDIKGSLKENIALRELAGNLFKLGEVELANDYIEKSIDDATFFASRLRNNQSASVMPLISRTYNEIQYAQKKYRTLLLMISVFFTCALVGALLFIKRQMTRLSHSHEQLKKAKEELDTANAELRRKGEEMQKANKKLADAGAIKEICICSFLKLCSASIITFENFKKTLFLKMKTGKQEDVAKLLASNQMVTESQNAFFSTFDHEFLQIFPDFVNGFNQLLQEEYRIPPLEKDKLNTDLRIYALVRLGITDSQQIADFLRCSLSTIYSYRSKIKKKAIHPEDFEADVAKLS